MVIQNGAKFIKGARLSESKRESKWWGLHHQYEGASP